MIADARRGWELRASASGPINQPTSPTISTSLHLHRGHKITIEKLDDDDVFVVESGCMLCEAALPSGQRHIMLLLYPTDVFSRAMVPPLANIKLAASLPTSLTRHSRSAVASDPAQRPLADQIAAGLARLLARSSMYATAMGRLTAMERLGTLLADLALHLGKAEQAGYTFEVPLSRRDMADYLALNPDSLSRLMSNLKERSVLVMPTRSRAIARSLDAVMATTPLAEALRRMRDSVGA